MKEVLERVSGMLSGEIEVTEEDLMIFKPLDFGLDLKEEDLMLFKPLDFGVNAKDSPEPKEAEPVDRVDIPFAKNKSLFGNKDSGHYDIWVKGNLARVKNWYKHGKGISSKEIAHRLGVYSGGGKPHHRLIGEVLVGLNLKSTGYISNMNDRTFSASPLFPESSLELVKDVLEKGAETEGDDYFRFGKWVFEIRQF